MFCRNQLYFRKLDNHKEESGLMRGVDLDGKEHWEGGFNL